jgi:hypothetical protein
MQIGRIHIILDIILIEDFIHYSYTRIYYNVKIFYQCRN